MEAINTRFKAVRQALGKTQKEFANGLGFGQAGISALELGTRVMSTYHIKAVCSIYNVNEHWLRTGEGEMFCEPVRNIFNDFAAQYELTNAEQRVAKYLLSLSSEQRQQILQLLAGLTDVLQQDDDEQQEIKKRKAIEMEVEAYRKELEAEYNSKGKLSVSAASEERSGKIRA